MSHHHNDAASADGALAPLHQVDVSPLLAEPAGSSAEIPAFTVSSDSDGEVLRADVHVRADRTNRGVRIVGSIAGTQEGLCARCLSAARASLGAHLDEEIVEDRFASDEIERFGPGNTVDLGRLAIEGLDLVRRIVLHCDPPCPERCEHCGATHPTVDCPDRELDPRLAALGRLIRAEPESKERDG